MIFCNNCSYYSRRTCTCDFMLRMSVRRGCPVEDCIQYLPRPESRAELKLPCLNNQALFRELGGSARMVHNIFKEAIK